MSKSNLLTLGSVLCDWLTATSYDDVFFEHWENKIEALADGKQEKPEKRKWQNYEGRVLDVEGGTLFVGKGVQVGRLHYAITVSGEAADDFLSSVLSFVRMGNARITRLDLQATAYKPRKWSQFDYLSRAKARGKSVGWAESRDIKAGALETAYVGSRSSDRLSRLYVKLTHGDIKLLRFEVEFKRDRAHAICKALARGHRTITEYWTHEIQATKDKELQVLFADVTNGITPVTIKIRVKTDTDKRERWLMQTCLPALRKYLWQHDAKPGLARAFDEVLNEYYE